MSNTPISKNQQVYTDRYGNQDPSGQGPNIRSQDPHTDVVNYEQQLFDEYGVEENGDFGLEDATAYRQIAEGSPTEVSPSENELFGDMNDEELVQSGRAMAAEDKSGELSDFENATVQLNTMLSDIEGSSIPASKKSSAIRQINELKKKMESGKIEDLDSVEELKETVRELIEEHPAFASRLTSQLSEAGIECATEQIEKALKHAGLSEEQISKIQLPTNAENSESLIAFFKELDPNFAQLFEASPYGKDSMNKLSTLLKLTLNLRQPPTMEKIAAFMEPAVTVTWNEEDLLNRVSGDWANEKRAAIQGLSRLVLTGQGLGEIHNQLWSGHNDFEQKHKVWNDIIRSGISNIYEAAGRNPYLLQRYLKMIPEQILRDLRDVVLAAGNERTEKHAVDLFDSQETHDILDWALAGGTPPDALKDDLPTGESS